MTVSQNFLDRIYTGKEGKLTAYSLKGLEVPKACLARLNKISENGISITIVDAVSTKYTSKVSKAGAEKGIKPVEIEVGDTILFNIDSQAQKDGKPSEDAAIISTIGALLKAAGVVEKEVFFMVCDLDSIPAKGFDEKYLAYLKAQGEKVSALEITRFEGEDSFIAACEEMGFNSEAWLERLAKMNGEVYVERQGYAAKKSYGDLLKERVEFFKAIDPALKEAILALTVSHFTEEVTEADGSDGFETTETPMDWGNFVRDCLTNI